MNIGIGKLGKSIAFNHKKWGLVGGDAAPSILFTTLAALNPDVNFYIVGKSDFGKLPPERKKEIFPNENVFDCWEGSVKPKGIRLAKDIPFEYHSIPLNWLNDRNIKLDSCLLFNGQTAQVNITNKIELMKSTDIASTLIQMAFYCGPMIHLLNETDIPLVLVSEDPRHIVISGRDLFNREKVVLSQINGTYKRKHIESYERQKPVIYTDIGVKYGETEKIFLVGEAKRDTSNLKKDKLISLYMNGHGLHSDKSRWPFVKEYIIDQFDEGMVYGKWNLDKYVPSEFHDKFEATRMGDMMNDVLATKYTLVVSIMPGFVTCKPWEMINFGIIPFFHESYDPSNLLGFSNDITEPYYSIRYNNEPVSIYEFLNVGSGCEMKQKIEHLENNPEDYKKLRNILSSMLKDSYYDGSHINNIMMSHVYESLGRKWEHSNSMLPKTFTKISSFEEQEKRRK